MEGRETRTTAHPMAVGYTRLQDFGDIKGSALAVILPGYLPFVNEDSAAWPKCWLDGSCLGT